MKLRTLLLLLFVATITLGGSAWYWLLHTNSGAAWVWAQAESQTDGALTSLPPKGDLSSGLVVHDLTYAADNLEVTAAKVSLALDIDFLPFAVEIASARVERARVAVGDAPQAQEEPADIPAMLRKLQLAFPIRVSSLVVDGLVLETPDFDHTIALLELKAKWQEAIEIEELRIDGEDIIIVANGSFELAGDLAHIGNVSVRLEPGLTGQTEAIEVDLHSEGDPDRLGLQISVANSDATAKGEIRRLFEQPEWDVEIFVQHYLWPLEESEEHIGFSDFTVRSVGSLGAYSLFATGDIQVPGMQPLSIAVEGDGGRDSFTASMLRAAGADLDVAGTARIEWATEPLLEASLAIARVDPQLLMPAWPDGYPLRGNMTARLDEQRITIGNSQLEIPRTGAVLHLDADIDRDSGNVQGALHWESLRWPLDGDSFDVKSDLGDIRIDGTLDAWSVDGMIELGTQAMSEGRFQIDGDGDRDGAKAGILEARVLGGTLAGELEYSWRGAQPWRGRLDVVTIDTGSLIAGWPGEVSGHVAASGTRQPQTLSAELRGVAGTLRGAPLQASGGFVRAGEKFVADELSIMHGTSMFELDGGLDEDGGLSFDVTSADVGDYVDDLAGDIKAHGVVRTSEDKPFLSLDLESDELRFRQIVLSELRIKDLREPGEVAGMRLGVASIRAGHREFSEVDASVAVTMERQSVTISAVHLNGKLSTSLEGALEDWSAPMTSGWRGTIKTVEIAPDDQHVAQLLSPAPLFVSAERVELEELCLGPDVDSSFCAAGNWAAGGAYSASARFTNVPVDLLDYVAVTGLIFDQVVNGEAQWSYRPASGPSGFGQLSTSPGRIVSADNPQLSLATGGGVLNFEIVDNALLSGTLGLPLPGTGSINGHIQLHDLGNLENSGIGGGFVADVSEIAILSQLFPAIDAATGRLHADMIVTGSIEEPVLKGILTIADGSLAYDPLGLFLEDLNLTGTMVENYRIDIEGEFRSGDGRGNIVAQADYRNIEEPSVRIALKGERLALVSVEDVRIAADPDIDIVIRPEALSINGKIHVAEALVQPVNLSASRINESPDVVIVAGELPDQPETKQGNGFRYSGVLDVSLGDNVVVDIDLARATVTGKTRFEWHGGPMPVANGRYDIAGTIAAFGQVLDIAEGSVRFPDVPADNPLLRIRAEREIYGNTQIKRAGVLVDGPLKRPVIEAYSQPATTEERALTLLVTGSDFDYEQGVGAIDFGTYIAPRLFVSYGVGVFERENIVSARFDLSRRFGIKASSGSKESGVDFNYRFEN